MTFETWIKQHSLSTKWKFNTPTELEDQFRILVGPVDIKTIFMLFYGEHGVGHESGDKVLFNSDKNNDNDALVQKWYDWATDYKGNTR